MPSEDHERKFIETCLELRLLNETDAKSLCENLDSSARDISQAALQRGLLTAADVDIVHSLQHPQDVAPGYQILNLVGRGAMGAVYRAMQIDLERIVALKIILISNVAQPNAAARFEREAKALARLQHPNIVQALNFGKHDGRYYFAMEFVPGRTCEELVRESGIMPPQAAWSIVRQVASGLFHAAGQNLIHRDIKPANLILLPPPEGAATKTEVVKIADFGLAMFADPSAEQLKLTTGDKVMGSPAYMSPEQFGGRDVDFRSDMYSLGATAWHLLFGKPPHQGRSIAALYQQKSERLMPHPDDLAVRLPEDQMSLLLGLLDPDPDSRPPSYGTLIDAIDALGVNAAAPTTTPVAVPIGASVGAPTSIVSEASHREFISQHPTLERAPPEPKADTATLNPVNVADDTVTQTVELSKSSSHPRLPRSRWLAAIAILALAAVSIGLFESYRHRRGVRLPTQVIGNIPLFDGVTLSGWDVGGSMVGAWQTVQAPDASTAIACITRQGALTRRFSTTAIPRVSLFVWLQKDSGPVDIDFAVDPANPSAKRGCVRLQGDQNQLGIKASDFGDVDVSFRSDALPSVFDRFHVIDIERQPTDWFVFLEEKFLGSIPIKDIGAGDAIRLVIHDNPSSDEAGPQVFFADVQLDELGLKETAELK
ncbi:Serine/threonine-protein kinase PrkC [Stieleria neptunia]|uniref:Serine/threonine-protein kinase PrkC n=1 Tax=Stieleria neptunia TaxID=2527979 RepID=A0A518HWL9_9BACT|nr:serine/threonine-protein kinase [Stieleria neptunia]QDV45157.1 Serine/threonine-protein kinase PrkC [Stieleria neptunia]